VGYEPGTRALSAILGARRQESRRDGNGCGGRAHVAGSRGAWSAILERPRHQLSLMQKYLTYLQDTSGNALVGASVTVNIKGGGIATIYSDNGVSQKTNPIITSSDGSAWFY